MHLPKELGANKCKNSIRNLMGTDSAELKHYFFNDSFTYSDRLTFQNQTETKQMPFTVSKLNIGHTCVFTYQPNTYDWITSTENSGCRKS